jgi:hypothetical protein
MLNEKQQCSRELATSDIEVVPKKITLTLKIGGGELLNYDGIYFLSGRTSFPRDLNIHQQ